MNVFLTPWRSCFFLSHLQQTKNYERLDEILKQIIYQCRFLYSVILTEYVAIDPRVCGCPSVCPSVRPYMFTCTKYDYFHVQRVKLSQSQHFIFEFTLLPVLTVFRPPFCPKVDDVERWITSPNLVISSDTQMPNFMENRNKMWPWSCYRFSNQNGGQCVIN